MQIGQLQYIQQALTQQRNKVLHMKTLYQLGVLAMIPLLAACSAASASSNGVAQVASPTTTAQAGTAADDYVLIWLLNGTPTQTPTVNPTTAALWATINAGTPTAAPTTARTPAPPSGSGNTSSATSSKAGSALTSSGPGDASRGEQLFHGGAGCMACHDTSSGQTIVGPSLKGIAARAGSRIPGMAAADYIHQHIVKPGAFTVPGFPPNVMPQNFAEMLSSQQIDDLVAYLETLK